MHNIPVDEESKYLSRTKRQQIGQPGVLARPPLAVHGAAKAGQPLAKHELARFSSTDHFGASQSFEPD
uniref:Uncharacterized protein n=1 Tax=Cannabis sativa TaxID=3483 RepID=A0A803PRH7_CANSA